MTTPETARKVPVGFFNARVSPSDMMRRRMLAPLSVIMMLTVLLAGCVADAPPDWGTESGEVMATMSTDHRNITLHNRLSSSPGEWTEGDVLPLIGCNGGTAPERLNDINASTTGGTPLTISGWLSHDKQFTDGSGKDNVAGHAIAMELVAWDTVKDWGVEDVTHVAIGKWDSPIYLKGRPLGEADDKFPDSGWAVLGLIAASEKVNKGFVGLAEWNRPIELKGYLMGENEDHGLYGYPEVKNCRIIDGTDDGFAGMFVVTSFKIGDRNTVDESNGYQTGHIPFIGRVLYLALLLLGGAGGAVGLFIYSTTSIRAQAAADAKTMLTEDQIRGAREVAGQVREHERATEHLKSRKKQEPEDHGAASKDDDEEPTIDVKVFDVAGMLGGDTGTDASDLVLDRKKHIRHGASVVQTGKAADMDDKLADLAEEAEDEAGYAPEPAPRRRSERRSSVVSRADDGYDDAEPSRAGFSVAGGLDRGGRDRDGPSRGGPDRGGGRGDRGGPSERGGGRGDTGGGLRREGPSRGDREDFRGGGGRGRDGGGGEQEPRRRAARRTRRSEPPPEEEQREEPEPRRRPQKETRKGPSVSEDDDSFSDFSFD